MAYDVYAMINGLLCFQKPTNLASISIQVQRADQDLEGGQRRGQDGDRLLRAGRHEAVLQAVSSEFQSFYSLLD